MPASRGTSSSCSASSPRMGRGFKADEDTHGKNAVIVLSHAMWQRRFGSDPGVLGRSVTLNRAPFTVIGVMPPGFYFPNREVEYWTPLALNPATPVRGGHFLGAIGRLKTRRHRPAGRPSR